MLAILLMTAVGGFSFNVNVLSDRSKTIHGVPAGERAEWKEHIEAIVPSDPRDADLARLLLGQARAFARDYYAGDTGDASGSFEATDTAGSLDVFETLEAASSDLVSVHVGASYYEASMAHPNSDASLNIVWSRRLHRPLTQADVLSIAPDRALKLKALAAFDNQEGIDASQFTDGLPLDWKHATVGPAGISWTFGPYELGGYASGGSATVSWASLAPYLRRPLPFSIAKLRAPADTKPSEAR